MKGKHKDRGKSGKPYVRAERKSKLEGVTRIGRGRSESKKGDGVEGEPDGWPWSGGFLCTACGESSSLLSGRPESDD